MDLLERFEQWTAMPLGSLSGWTAYPVVRRGELAGVGVMQGFEIHFAAAPEWRGRLMLRKVIQDFLGPLIELKGFLTTRVQRGNNVAGRFVERLGFTRTRGDSEFDYYMLTAVPFVRET